MISQASPKATLCTGPQIIPEHHYLNRQTNRQITRTESHPGDIFFYLMNCIEIAKVEDNS